MQKQEDLHEFQARHNKHNKITILIKFYLMIKVTPRLKKGSFLMYLLGEDSLKVLKKENGAFLLNS